MALQRYSVGGEVALLWASDVPGLLATCSDLYRPITVLVERLMADNLYAVELKDCAWCAPRRDRIIDGSHALFDR